MRALVIDDSRAVRLILCGFLQELGFAVEEAGDGLEALEVLGAGEPFDLALVDWNMPRMDGHELLLAIQAGRVPRPTRLMMVTTEIEMTQVVRALEAGADEYVMKPFNKEMIREKIEILGLPLA